MPKHTRLFIILCALTLALGVAAVVASDKLEGGSQILYDTGLRHGMQNSALAVDDQRGLLFAGTYANKLIAYKDGVKAWTFEAGGSFVKLVARPELGLVYAASADGRVYILEADTGAPVGELNAQRRIFDIDVTADGSLVLVSAGVNTAKHNLMLFTSQGEQRYNEMFRTQIKGCAFSSDDQSILLVNSRGELRKLDFEGQELAIQKTAYEQVSLCKIRPGEYVSVGTDGGATVFDDNLTILASLRASLEAGDTATVVGANGNIVFVGTKERYLYALDWSGRQIWVSRFDNSLSCVLSSGDEVYVTGLGDFILRLDARALTGSAASKDTAGMLRSVAPAFFALAAIFLMLAIPLTNGLLRRFVRAIVLHRIAYLLLLPVFALLILFNYAPTFMAFTRAFTDWSKTSFQTAQIGFVGLDNFRMMFTEDYFLRGMQNLGLIVLTSFVKTLTVPLLLAWMVSMMRSGRKKYAYRFLLVLPIVVPGVVSALLWKQIYDPQIGLINQLLGKMGLESLQRVWLGNEQTAIWAIIFMGFPFVNAMAFLVYYGGFSNIDHSVLESAVIDGAKRGRTFLSIQLPMIAPQVKLMLTLTFISSVQDFYPIYLLTGGGPGTSTYVPGLEIYLNATTFGRYGYACALGILMFLFIMVGTLVNLRLQQGATGLGKGGVKA